MEGGGWRMEGEGVSPDPLLLCLSTGPSSPPSTHTYGYAYAHLLPDVPIDRALLSAIRYHPIEAAERSGQGHGHAVRMCSTRMGIGMGMGIGIGMHVHRCMCICMSARQVRYA